MSSAEVHSILENARVTDFQYLMSHDSYQLMDEDYPTLYGVEHEPIEDQLKFKVTGLDFNIFPCDVAVDDCQDASNYPILSITKLDDNSLCENLKDCLDIVKEHAYECKSGVHCIRVYAAHSVKGLSTTYT